MQVVGVMYFIDVTQVLLVLFFVQKCQVVLDYGGYNMVHHKVLHKKQRHVHGHVKQVDDVLVQVELLLIQVQQLVKVNKKRKLFFHNHFVQLHHHHRVLLIQEQIRVDRVVEVLYHNNLQVVARQIQVVVERIIQVVVEHIIQVVVEHLIQVILVLHFLVLEHRVEIQVRSSQGAGATGGAGGFSGGAIPNVDGKSIRTEKREF